MNWNHFSIVAIASAVCWILSAFFALNSAKKSNKQVGGLSLPALMFSVAGIAIMSVFILSFWLYLDRPPLKTIGETRLWYALFMGVAGLITYVLWRFSWILSFSGLMSIVFMSVNLLKPEIHNQVLMPALQSSWFIPHVTVYIFSYALLACSFLLAMAALIKPSLKLDKAINHLVIAGITCFTLGMLFGALWAKKAWGNYWSWDLKETWAAITWMTYLLYLHLSRFRYKNKKIVYLVLIFAFVALQLCWYGLNYLPAAQQSIHVYG